MSVSLHQDNCSTEITLDVKDLSTLEPDYSEIKYDYDSITFDETDIDLDAIKEDIETCDNTVCMEVDYSTIGLNVDDLTDGEVIEKNYYGQDRLQWEGSKVADKLMHFTDQNLRVQYDEGRITGKEYASVYEQTINNVIQQSTNLLVQEQQLKLEAFKAQKQAELVDLQKVELQTKVALAKLQLEAELANIENIYYSRAKIKEEAKLIHAQRINLEEKTKTELVQRDVLLRQEEQLVEQIILTKIKELIEKENIPTAKLKAESIRSQIKLYDRQRIGFDDNMMVKLLTTQLDSWSTMYSAGMLDLEIEQFPDFFDVDEFNDIYRTYKRRVDNRWKYDSEATQPVEREYDIDDRVCDDESVIAL